MREIKFRGKRISGHEMLLGDINHINNKVYIFPRLPDTPLNSPDWFEVDPETVGQRTGLKDKNGKEIYELHEINNKYRVVFKFNRYILQHISNKDINYDFEQNGEYEITREYSPLEED